MAGTVDGVELPTELQSVPLRVIEVRSMSDILVVRPPNHQRSLAHKHGVDPIQYFWALSCSRGCVGTAVATHEPANAEILRGRGLTCT